LINAGTFDGFKDMNRSQFFLQSGKDELFIDSLLHYGQKIQDDTLSSASSLFGGMEEMKPVRPVIPPPVEYNKLDMLKKEKELVGMYLSAHPLDSYSFELRNLANCSIKRLRTVSENCNSDPRLQNKELFVAGLVTEVKTSYTKTTNKPMCRFTIEDYTSDYTFALFGKDYENYIGYMKENEALLIQCSTQSRYFRKDASNTDEKPVYEVKIKNMTLLANAVDDMVKEMTVTLPVSKLEPSMRTSLVKRLRHEEKGNTSVIIKVVEDIPADGSNNRQQISVDYVSTKMRIRPSAGLVAYFESIPLKYSFKVLHQK
ncbi:MAG: hypothetical protein LKK19_06280, partial [Bacteroidales bacterium]|nr:hypothetical protein [Bacteroidales bacterium]